MVAGTCPTCCTRAVYGEVENLGQNFLDEEQIEQGFSVICVAYPLSDATLVTHQEVSLYGAVTVAAAEDLRFTHVTS